MINMTNRSYSLHYDRMCQQQKLKFKYFFNNCCIRPNLLISCIVTWHGQFQTTQHFVQILVTSFYPLFQLPGFRHCLNLDTHTQNHCFQITIRGKETFLSISLLTSCHVTYACVQLISAMIPYL